MRIKQRANREKTTSSGNYESIPEATLQAEMQIIPFEEELNVQPLSTKPPSPI
ncbi:putative rsc complex subunit [Sesbania bispinosa]|nr:putative rsc complex subunit [Sesbania bispinosa]